MRDAIDPIRTFQSTNGDTLKVKTLFATPAVGTTTIFATPAGKIFRIMGWKLQSNDAAPGFLTLRSSTTILAALTTPSNVNGETNDLPLTDSGYMESGVGESIIADVTTTLQIIHLFYVLYTP